ncbi:hypothetical protein [uncultured Ferrovibrio sp.]|jgi:hypothetical protein|uniref:hypothetical protein n=1 Tax=uncultured Ferrovibrio sp. TaxID=1576913 RepID=UPI002638BB7F|nr:hypothetical protein [uncultured Ferrovibrio sp.]
MTDRQENRAEFDTRERVLSAEKARSGVKTGHMRYVVIFGIGGVIIGFIIAWLIGV